MYICLLEPKCFYGNGLTKNKKKPKKRGDYMENRKKIKGIRSSFIFIPTMVIIGILYAFIIVATVFINRYSYASSKEMENTSLCLRYVSTMQG